ncbi:MAG TPA: PQQ-binding-like beta-propeller repeat protein, partial [Roseiflexaceae bacterium]|nr:PQQ-binding-like beta-propeller repeat protein [Roseiflexaceae bacterium]
MDDTRSRDEGSLPAPPLPSAVDNAWWGMLLTLVVLLGIAGAILGLWWIDRQQRMRGIEHYLPIGSSAAQSYQNINSTHQQSYRSVNISRYDGLGALNLMPIAVQAQVVAAMRGIPADDVTSEVYGDFLKSGSADLVVAQELMTEYSATGPVTVTNALYLVHDSDVALVMLNGNSLDPAAVVLDTALQPGAERVTTGMLGDKVPYTMTVHLEGREALQAPLGSFDDCLRVRQTIEAGGVSDHSRSWYCAGLGLARQETLTPDGQVRETSELVSAAGTRGGITTNIAPIRNQAITSVSQRVVQPERPIALGTTWTYRELGSSTMHVTSPSTLTDDAILLGSVSGRVVAIDRQTHQAKWRFNTGGAVYGAPAVGAGVVLVGSVDRSVYALDAETGAFRWAVRTGDAITGGATIQGDTAYIGSEDHRLYALDVASGAERWHFDTEGPIAATPTVAGDTVYVGSDDGALYAVAAETGELRWAFATENAVA